MPRPCKDDPRDWNFTLRLSVAERARLEREAGGCGITLAAYARRRLFQDAATEVAMPGIVTGTDEAATSPATQIAVLALSEQIRRAGVNLNQIARRMNEYRQVTPDELYVVLDELRACLRQFGPASS